MLLSSLPVEIAPLCARADLRDVLFCRLSLLLVVGRVENRSFFRRMRDPWLSRNTARECHLFFTQPDLLHVAIRPGLNLRTNDEILTEEVDLGNPHAAHPIGLDHERGIGDHELDFDGTYLALVNFKPALLLRALDGVRLRVLEDLR